MTINPPVNERTATGPEFEALYVEHHFDDLLPRCTKEVVEDLYFPDGYPLHPDTIHKYGALYRLDGVKVAVIFHYTHADRTVTRHFRMLVAGGITYRPPVRPPVHPGKV